MTSLFQDFLHAIRDDQESRAHGLADQVNVLDQEGKAALLAAQWGRLWFIPLMRNNPRYHVDYELLAHGRLEEDLIERAANHGHSDWVAALVKQSNARSDMVLRKALFHVVTKGNEKAMDLLLALGARFEATSVQAEKATLSISGLLMHTALGGHQTMLRRLMSLPAVNFRENGNLALLGALTKQHATLAQDLLSCANDTAKFNGAMNCASSGDPLKMLGPLLDSMESPLERQKNGSSGVDPRR